MTTIVTRAGKGSPLTWNEVDNNFTNLNSAKYESGDSPSFAGLTISTFTSGSVLFAGASGAVTQDNANLFWNDSSNTLSIGATSNPSSKLGVTTSSSGALDLYRTGAAAEVRLNFLNDNASSSAVTAGRVGAYLTTTTAGAENGALLFSTTSAGTTAEKMRIDSAGNLGIGVTPSATGSTYRSIELYGAGNGLSATTGTLINLSANAYRGASGFVYGSTAVATLYQQSAGTHNWYNAVSGTAGTAITFTQSMIITSGGNVGIATTDPTGGFTFDSAYRMLGISGSGSASTASTGALNLINNRATPASGDYFGLINFFSSNSVSGNILKAQILSSSDGSGGVTGGYGGNLRFYTKPDNSATAATERMRIDSSGNVLIGVTSANANGGILQLAGGITFPATQVADTDANTLDDYEEGTFTPTIVGATTAGTGTYTSQIGKYTKVGNAVTVTISMTWTAHTGTGNMRISGLPFATPATYDFMLASMSSNIALTAGNTIAVYLPVSSSQPILYQQPTGGGAIANVPMDTAGSIYCTGTYLI